MRAVEMDLLGKYRKEIDELKEANTELRRLNRELEQRLQDLHGEYMLLRYQFRGMPTLAEVLKLRQEMLALKKELRMRGWSDTG